MSEHYTKNTLAASCWCKVCHKETLHRVDGGRRGPCLDCLNKPKHSTPEKQPPPPPPKQGDLF